MRRPVKGQNRGVKKQIVGSQQLELNDKIALEKEDQFSYVLRFDLEIRGTPRQPDPIMFTGLNFIAKMVMRRGPCHRTEIGPQD